MKNTKKSPQKGKVIPKESDTKRVGASLLSQSFAQSKIDRLTKEDRKRSLLLVR